MTDDSSAIVNKLRALRRAGAITEDEIAAVEAALTARGADHGKACTGSLSSAELEEIVQDFRYDRLRTNWEQEREQYLIYPRHGKPCPPTRVEALISGSPVIAFGLMVYFLPKGDRRAGESTIVSGLIVMLGVGIVIYYFIRARAYERAHGLYKRRRRRARDRPQSLDAQSELEASPPDLGDPA